MVATDDFRRREKLTLRFARLMGRAMTGGLLGQCELAREEREAEFRDWIDRLDR